MKEKDYSELPLEELEYMYFLQTGTSFEWPLGEWPSPRELKKIIDSKKEAK